MDKQSGDPMDNLLRDAYPAVEVSPDFTLRMWRKLMDRPVAELWKVPVPAVAAALLLGIVSGIWSWNRNGVEDAAVARVVARAQRWDLFGNAPHDSLAGSVLRRMGGEKA